MRWGYDSAGLMPFRSGRRETSLIIDTATFSDLSHRDGRVALENVSAPAGKTSSPVKSGEVNRLLSDLVNEIESIAKPISARDVCGR
jgi:hypothetical protein